MPNAIQNPNFKRKNWSFTLNNPTQEDADRLDQINPDLITYLIYGREIGEQGTPHLQGCVFFRSSKNLQEVIHIIGQAHFSVTRSTVHTIEYCMKDGNFVEKGINPALIESRPQGRKRKNNDDEDLEAFKDKVKSGEYNEKELRETHSLVMAKHQNFCKQYIADHKPRPQVEVFPLRDWQQEVHGKLILPPHCRKILFIVDAIGNSGKSWFARYYSNLHEKTQILTPGKKADMAYALDDSSRVVFMDCPRSKSDVIQYDFLEEIKNGFVFSNKYESKMKEFASPPHLVVLMNETPDMSKLSLDRYDIMIINESNNN